MSRIDEIFKPALIGKKIPILTLDHKWHQLFTQAAPDKQLLRLEEELKALLKKRSKASDEIKKINRLKRTLMDGIMHNAGSAVSGDDKLAEKKQEESKRLINECNEKIAEYEEELIGIPGQIDKVNKELMLKTMEVCYDSIKQNKHVIVENRRWIKKTREELKERIIEKEEKEEQNHALYSYMHDIFGADVIDIFDMQYLRNEEKDQEEDKENQ